jgi:hypothetical protein
MVKLSADPNEVRERVAQWMIQRGYATGHGDTVEDLLVELEGQARTRKHDDGQESIRI